MITGSYSFEKGPREEITEPRKVTKELYINILVRYQSFFQDPGRFFKIEDGVYDGRHSQNLWEPFFNSL